MPSDMERIWVQLDEMSGHDSFYDATEPGILLAALEAALPVLERRIRFHDAICGMHTIIKEEQICTCESRFAKFELSRIADILEGKNTKED